MLVAWLAAMLPAGQGAPAADTDAPAIIPMAVVPLMAKAPVIDGNITEDEWPTVRVGRFVSKGDSLQPRPGQFWVASDGNMLYVAVRSAVHPVLGPVAERKPRTDGRDATRLEEDDSVEIWLDSDPNSKTARHYQLLVNTLGAQSEKMFDRLYNSERAFWQPEVFLQAHRVENGVWSAEVAVSLKDLRVQDVSKAIGLRVCRNYRNPTDQAHWAPKVQAFSDTKTMPQIRFVPVAPVVKEAGFQDDQGIRIAVELTNPTAQAITLKARLGYNPAKHARDYKDWNLTLQSGQKQVLEYTHEFLQADNYTALGEILVMGADGGVFYHRDFRWETRPANLWSAVDAQSRPASGESSSLRPSCAGLLLFVP